MAKVKTSAKWAPQSKQETMDAIKALGDAQREHMRKIAHLNDQIAQATAVMAPSLDELRAQIAQLQEGIHTWCSAHREELCGKGKSANLQTGEISWRMRPPSVRVAKVEAVIGWLKTMGMAKYVRVKEEINKDLLLEDKETAGTIPGITIISGVEDFVVQPFELPKEQA